MAGGITEHENIDLTIAGHLAEFDDSSSSDHHQHFPATDLIRTLLICHISATTELSTHLHLSRQLVLRCTRAFTAIHQLMVASSQPGTPINWDLFDAYTRGILILESVLLSFETADLSPQQNHLPDDDVLGSLRFIFIWNQARTQLVEALKCLASDEFLGLWITIESGVDVDTKEVLRNTRALLQSTPLLEIARDDLTILTVVWKFFETFTSELSLFDAIPKTIATNILEAMHNISLTLHSQSLIDQSSKESIQQAFSSSHYMFAQIFIKSLMLITIPFSLLSNKRSNPKPLDDNLKRDLARDELWKAMQILAKMLLDALNDKSKRGNLRAFEDEYACLRKLLLSNLPKSSDPLVDETLQLLQLSTQIFRRFQQRSVELIRLLYSLDQESSTPSMPPAIRDEVRKVFQETIELLKSTEAKFRGRSLRASVPDEEYNEQATAFERIFSNVRQCGKLLDPSKSWLSKEADFLAAVELDENHMKGLEKGRFKLE